MFSVNLYSMCNLSSVRVRTAEGIGIVMQVDLNRIISPLIPRGRLKL